MELLFQVAAGAGVITLASVLTHFFYVAVHVPEKLNLGLAYDRRHTFGSRAYLGLVVASWLAFAFSGAYGLLSSLTSEAALGLAGLVALASLGLLTHIERSAARAYSLRRSTLICRELENLIARPGPLSESTIAMHQEKAGSAESLVERGAHEALAILVTQFAERDTKLCELAVERALREAEQRTQEREKAERAARAAAAKQADQNQFKRMLKEKADALLTASTLDALAEGVVARLEPSIARQKWQPLVDFADKLGRLGLNAPVCTMLQKIPGVQSRSGTDFTLEMVGNERNGYYAVRSVLAGKAGDIAEGLIFESSLDGLIAALFVSSSLPRLLAWGHGFYGRDQVLVTSLNQTIDILEANGIRPDVPELSGLTVPHGFRVKRLAGGSVAISCLAYRPGKGFYDVEVGISEGNLLGPDVTVLFQWGRGIYY
jgi:hypothetical protein